MEDYGKQLFFQDEPQRVRKIPAKLRVKLAFGRMVEISETPISIICSQTVPEQLKTRNGILR